MKNTKTFSILFLQLFCIISFAQQTISKGKIEYDMTFIFENSSSYKSSLVFNNTISQFTYSSLQQEDIKTRDDNNKLKIQYADTTSNEVVIDRSTSKMYNYKHVGYSKDYYRWIEETTPTLEWVLYPETKKLGTLVCNKATTTFRGRNYTAWYTTDIKNSLGPWKLHGLPGMILEAYDEKREVSFVLKKITIPFISKIDFNVNDIETITREEEKTFVKEEEKDIQQKFQRSLSRGMKGEMKFVKLEIEKD